MRAGRDPIEGLADIGTRHVLEDCLAALDGRPLPGDRRAAADGLAVEVSGMAAALRGVAEAPLRVEPGSARRLSDLARFVALTRPVDPAALAPGLDALAQALGRLAGGLTVERAESGRARAIGRDWLSALEARALFA